MRDNACLVALAIAAFLIPSLSARADAAASASSAAGDSIAFYYGDHPPLDELSTFSRVVIDPDNIDERGMRRLHQYGASVLAYLSVGEVRLTRRWRSDVRDAWIVGENAAWGSDIMDMANPEWRAFVAGLAERLERRGFDGVFLDTLDSYRIPKKGGHWEQRQREGLKQLIHMLRKRLPNMKILLNRGFDIVDDVASEINGVVAESLFRTWDPAGKRYGETSPEGRAWLLRKLTRVRRALGLPVYVIDYAPPGRRDLARETAARISAAGFTPWVANPSLDMLGVGAVEIAPRKVLVLFDSRNAALPYSPAHAYLPAPLEYMGYVVTYQDIRQPLPSYPLIGRYAGVVCWWSDNETLPPALLRWIERRMDEGVPLAFMDAPAKRMPASLLRRMGLEVVPGRVYKPVRIATLDEVARASGPRYPATRGLTLLRAVDPRVQVHESIVDARLRRMDVLMTAPWGGLALTPYVLRTDLDGNEAWRIDIFRFLRKALHLSPMPAFDVTTENGARLLMTHIDGDGAASRAVMPGYPLAIRVIRDEILRRYRLPATVSVIVSEVMEGGLFPERARRLREIARGIFAESYVEIASHTFSHPFNWARAPFDPKAHLNVPGYHYSLRREIEGSVSYINARLAPPGKRVRVFLWSGDALPGERALAMTDALGLRNMNGGNTIITRTHSSMTFVSGMSRPVGGRLQVYAPAMNENIYTNDWTAPRYGYERVIETFRMTDRPRRLKPIDIYYHFYSGSEYASLNALKRVYDWSVRQDVMPVWVSEYVDKVNAYERAVLARNADGDWLAWAPGALRTLRIRAADGWPEPARSSGLAGVRDLPQGRYIHLAPASGGVHRVVLRLTARQHRWPHLVRANAPLLRWERRGRTIDFRMRGHVPLRFSVSEDCELRLNGGNERVRPERRGGAYAFSLKTTDTGHARLVCR